ncbi:hypothetical protein [Streptomyces sp. NPDC055058]
MTLPHCAETAALNALADGLSTPADAIARTDDQLTHQPVGELRGVLNHPLEPRRTAAGRTNARVTRMPRADAAGGRCRREKEIAGHLGRSLDLARRSAAHSGPVGWGRTGLPYSLRTVATDTVTSPGVDLLDALDAVRTGTLDGCVPPARMPLGWLCRWAARHTRRWSKRIRDRSARSSARSGRR